MRRGYMLVEMLLVFVVVSAVSVALAGLFVTVLKDIPQSYRITEANTTLLDMLKQMGDDIDRAEELPKSFGQYVSDEKQLLIKSEQKIICYRLQDGRIIRDRLKSAGQVNGSDRIVWNVPHGKAEWHVWRKDDKGYAVEVTTYIEQIVRRRLKKKMANSHLYFVGALREADQVK